MPNWYGYRDALDSVFRHAEQRNKNRTVDIVDNLFLSVGAMKAGTSWLFRQLRNHPDIFSTPVKEIHYFAHIHTNIAFLDFNSRIQAFKSYLSWLDPQSNVDSVRRDLRWYLSYLDDPVDDAWFIKLFEERGVCKYCAEYSNLLSIQDDAAWKHILQIAKNVKVIYTLRNPLSRLWSHTRFHHAISNFEGSLTSWSTDDFRKFFISEGLINHGNYYDNITKIRGHLTSDQMLISLFDDFRHDPARELRKLEVFLGISHIHYAREDLETVCNPSPSLVMPEVFVRAASEIVARELEQLDSIDVEIPESWSRRE